MKHCNVLVFPCGSEVGLELNRALKDVSFLTLYGASSVTDHGKYVFENYIEGLPFVTEPNFIEKMNEVVRQNDIDYIYPAMDQIVDVLSAHRDELAATLVAPGHDAVTVCRNKARTYERLAGMDFLPKVYHVPDEVDSFPVIIKPEEGYGSRGFQILYSAEELRFAWKQAEVPMVICEYLPGEEYTVDCFTDRHGQLKYVSCRNRNRIRNGISVNSRLLPPDERIYEIAGQISEKISLQGAWFFQLKRNVAGEYKLLEVATRVAGTMCVERGVGVNLPLLTIFDMMGYDVEIDRQLPTAEVDRALYNVFHLEKNFTQVYVDFDDTMVVHGRINTNLMRYLYQCVNQKIPVFLITKHDTDIRADLRKYHIAENLFAEIIHITHQQEKRDFMAPDKDALFIDDSFSERKRIRDAFDITTLGVDAVECLIDHRQ